MLWKILLLVSVAAVAVSSLETSLEGAKAYTVNPRTKNERGILHNLQRVLPGVDILQYAHIDGREARVVVAKDSQKSFESILKFVRIPFEIYFEDVESVARREIQINEFARIMARSNQDSKISFTAYNRHAEINAYLDDLAERFPSRVTVRNMGLSTEGRMIKAIIISTTGGTDSSKPVFIADGGLHAREWIAPAQGLYMIRKLVEDITESDLVNQMDWVIIPLINPDGYEHSHSSSSTRLWRKTRSTASSSTCPGVDGNRNFDFQWMSSGSSNNPCSDIFAGPMAFSEPETRILRDLVEEFEGRTRVYMAIHSYGSYFLYPYGYNGQPTPDNAELHAVGLRVAAAIDDASLPGSKKYLVGNSGAALNYLAAGASDDWTYAVGNIKLSYTLELPGGGVFGFDLPPSRIQQVVTETWEGVIVLARYVLQG